MRVEKTEFDGLLILQPKIFNDERGVFFESWNDSVFKTLGLNISFIQDNQSLSKKNVLRGLHFQNHPHGQGKLVRVSKGKALDVALDLRKDSKTYGKHFKQELSDQNTTMLWIPHGFAHGFISLEDQTVFQYKCDALYHQESEDCILWNDPSHGIDWGIKNPIVSAKDQRGKSLKDINLLY